MAAKAAAKQWAAGLAGAVEVLGLVLVADAPGRTPKALRDQIPIIGGGFPRTWQLPWIEACRLGEPLNKDSRELRRFLNDLHLLLTADDAPGVTNRKGNDHG